MGGWVGGAEVGGWRGREVGGWVVGRGGVCDVTTPPPKNVTHVTSMNRKTASWVNRLRLQQAWLSQGTLDVLVSIILLLMIRTPFNGHVFID